MNLFNSDLYRNFGIGFAVGALALLVSHGGDILGAVPHLIGSLL